MRTGSIMAAIITNHIPRNEETASNQLCPCILIQVIDMIQPPGMAMPPDMELHQQIVAAALTTNKSAPIPRIPMRAPGDSLGTSFAALIGEACYFCRAP